jgi:phosphatidylethanolamine-binding protein (PEBP) family uncharacterized protein
MAEHFENETLDRLRSVLRYEIRDLDEAIPDEDFDISEVLLSEAFMKGTAKFRDLHPDLRAHYRDQIEALKAELSEEALVNPRETDWKLATSTVTLTLPDGSTLTEASGQGDPPTQLRDSTGNVTAQPETDYEPTGKGKPSIHGFAKLRPRIIFVGGGILSLLALGFVLLIGGGDDNQDTSDAVAGDSPSLAASAAPAVAVSEDVCTTVRQQEIVLQLSSRDVQPTLPAFFALDTRDNNDYPTPRLDWSTVPPETTELVVLVFDPDPSRVDAYRADPKLWWRGESIEAGGGGAPIGAIRWTLIGIDPAATSLAATSLSDPAPPGTTELDRNQGSFGGRPRPDVDVNVKFRGPREVGRTYLFTVFALCYPPDSVPEVSEFTYDPGWLQRESVATGWFFSDAAW